MKQLRTPWLFHLLGGVLSGPSGMGLSCKVCRVHLKAGKAVVWKALGLQFGLLLLEPHPMCFLMSNKVWALSESPPTLGAHIWPLPSVSSLMPGKVGTLAEGFPTLLTTVGLSPSMSSQVLRDGWAIIEGPPTLWTLKWPLSTMNSVMLCEGGALNKSFPTGPARVRPLSCVDLLMDREIPSVLEQLTTFTAPANLAPLVNLDEEYLLSMLADSFPTVAAFPGSPLFRTFVGSCHMGAVFDGRVDFPAFPSFRSL